MNTLLEEKKITEVACGTNFTYVLGDFIGFSFTDYKVLQSQGDKVFVSCMKILHNGSQAMFYNTQGQKNLFSILSSLDESQFMEIMVNLLSGIVKVKKNGFLSCQNIDISFDKIFVGVHTLKVSLIYLPTSKGFFDDYVSFENELRTSLIKIIDGLGYESPAVMKFKLNLPNGMLSIENLIDQIQAVKSNVRMHSERYSAYQDESHSAPESDRGMSYGNSGAGMGAGSGSVGGTDGGPQAILVAYNGNAPVEFIVNKPEYHIGKSPLVADACISFNNAISRKHCKISKNGNQYYVTDLNSANGTYLNKIKLRPNQAMTIQNGDVLRLANVDIHVKIMTGVM